MDTIISCESNKIIINDIGIDYSVMVHRFILENYSLQEWF